MARRYHVGQTKQPTNPVVLSGRHDTGVPVNKRRKEAGFELSVEENATRLNAAYESATRIEEVKKTYVFKRV